MADQSVSENEKHVLDYEGICPICCKRVDFHSDHPWLREHLICRSCNSLPRERALALVLEELHPDWRDLRIHESSPYERGISEKLRMEGKEVMRSHFFPNVPVGETVRGFRNEDLQRMTFPDEAFDMFIALDVFEHILEPDLAFREVWRTLRVGGAMLCTWPVRNNVAKALELRARRGEDGTVEHLKPPVYHGNPIDPQSGTLVTVDFGYDIHVYISDVAPFDVRVYRFADKTHGLLGDCLDVFYCRKRANGRVRVKRRAPSG